MCKENMKIIHKSSALKTGQKEEIDANLTCLSIYKRYKAGRGGGMGQNELK